MRYLYTVFVIMKTHIMVKTVNCQDSLSQKPHRLPKNHCAL